MLVRVGSGRISSGLVIFELNSFKYRVRYGLGYLGRIYLDRISFIRYRLVVRVRD